MALRVVLDTNVVFEGLTKQTSACGLIIDAWRAGLITVCVSNSLMLEYEDVLSRKLGEQRWYETRLILKSSLHNPQALRVLLFLGDPHHLILVMIMLSIVR